MQKKLAFSKLKFTVAIILKFIKGFQELYRVNFLKILYLLSFLIERSFICNPFTKKIWTTSLANRKRAFRWDHDPELIVHPHLFKLWTFLWKKLLKLFIKCQFHKCAFDAGRLVISVWSVLSSLTLTGVRFKVRSLK